MRLLALVGSLCVFVYAIGSLALLANSVSRFVFCLADRETRTFWFGARLGAVLLWPLMICSEHGRLTLLAIWKGEDQ